MADERNSARPLSELDKASRERIERLMGETPKAITAGDRAFLEARRDYLTADQRKDFGIKGKVNLDDADGDGEGDQYDEMNADALKKELKKRNLPVSGKVDDLRARLRESDAQA